MKIKDYTYCDDIKKIIMEIKDVITLKEFFYQSEKVFKQIKKRNYLLTHNINQMTMLASDNFNDYCDEFVFDVDYTNSIGRIAFHGYLIEQAPISLRSYQRINK